MANMAAQYSTSRMFAFGWGYLSLTHCFSVIAKNVTINYMSPKAQSSTVSATFLLQTVCVRLLPL